MLVTLVTEEENARSPTRVHRNWVRDYGQVTLSDDLPLKLEGDSQKSRKNRYQNGFPPAS